MCFSKITILKLNEFVEHKIPWQTVCLCLCTHAMRSHQVGLEQSAELVLNCAMTSICQSTMKIAASARMTSHVTAVDAQIQTDRHSETETDKPLTARLYPSGTVSVV